VQAVRKAVDALVVSAAFLLCGFSALSSLGPLAGLSTYCTKGF
jgi:hypothetical protein